jgi:hypothetical protein
VGSHCFLQMARGQQIDVGQPEFSDAYARAIAIPGAKISTLSGKARDITRCVYGIPNRFRVMPGSAAPVESRQGSPLSSSHRPRTLRLVGRAVLRPLIVIVNLLLRFHCSAFQLLLATRHHLNGLMPMWRELRARAKRRVLLHRKLGRTGLHDSHSFQAREDRDRRLRQPPCCVQERSWAAGRPPRASAVKLPFAPPLRRSAVPSRSFPTPASGPRPSGLPVPWAPWPSRR